jgi:hypothetical protein
MYDTVRHCNTCYSHGSSSTQRFYRRESYRYPPRPVPSVDSIAAIAEFEKPEDAIIIAQLELEYLDN